MYKTDYPNPMPSQYTMDLHLVFVPGSEYLDPHLDIQDHALGESSKRVLLAKQTVTFEVMDVDIKGLQIEALKKQKQRIIADAHVAAERIEQQIQSLLAIEYHPEAKS